MTSEDEATDGTELYPRMYETIEQFVSKFTNNRLHIKEQGQSLEMKNPDDGQKTNLTTLVGYLVNEYVRFTDLVSTLTKKLPSDRDDYGALWSEARTKRLRTAMHLSQTIAFAYAFNLVDEGFDKELDDFRNKNAELGTIVAELTQKLEVCEKDNEGLRKILGKSKQLGDVSR